MFYQHILSLKLQLNSWPRLIDTWFILFLRLGQASLKLSNLAEDAFELTLPRTGITDVLSSLALTFKYCIHLEA